MSASVAAAASSSKRLHLDSLPALIVEAQSFCGANGLVMVSPSDSLVHAPISLYPTKFPRKSFAQALELSLPFNKLVDACSRDDQFLRDTLQETVQGDPFTKRLLDLYNQYGGERSKQKLQLGLHRSDYMLDFATQRLLQIEVNTIASSFGCLSARVTRLHKHLLQHKPYLLEDFDPASGGNIPENDADKQLPFAIAAAHREYELQMKPPTEGSFVVFIVQENERNYVDQRHLEYELSTAHGISVVRLSLAQVMAKTTVGEDGALLLMNRHVSVVYFRAGYTPTDYPTELEWEGRARLESTTCIKCPSIGYHLAGAKKIQQELAKPGVVERFVRDAAEAKQVRECFAGLWSLDEREALDPKVLSKVMQEPHKFVIKPQREGGGNNLYGDEVKQAMETMPKQELASHILMQRIFPPTQPAKLMRNAHVMDGNAVCELGVYSTYLGDGTRTVLNQRAGYLVRTKFEGVDEGGVATGFSALSSLWLVD